MENIQQPAAMSEMAFRRAAGLCTQCGQGKAGPDELCQYCGEEVELVNMRAQWKKWGIAA